MKLCGNLEWHHKKLLKNSISAINPLLVVISAYILIFISAPGISLLSAVHDDGLFMQWSNSILNEEWLGSWSVLTTSKGPLHSLLTAVAARWGINPFFYKRMFYLLSAFVFAITGLKKAPTWLRTLTLITLLFDPFQFSETGLRNLREGTYIPLQLIFFGLGCWSLGNLQEKKINWVRMILAIFSTSTCLGLILITREARLIAWLEMVIWLLLACSLVAWRIRKRIWKFSALLLLLLSFSVSGVIGIAKLPILIIASLNNSSYQYAISNSFEEGNFPLFYGRLISIGTKEEPFITRVPVRQSLINTIVENSPKGGALKLVLTNLDPGWKVHGCAIYPETCGEYVGGWFVWALRDAIGKTIRFPANENSFQIVANLAYNELNSMCKQSNSIVCEKSKVGYMPSLSHWGFSNPEIKLAKEGMKMAAVVAIPLYNPDSGNINIHPASQNNLEKPLRIQSINSNEATKWNFKFQIASKAGKLCKWVMIGLCAVSLYIALTRRRIAALFNLSTIWIFSSLTIQLLLYAAVSITSFPGTGYLGIASPLFICLLGLISCQLLESRNGKPFCN